MPLKKNLFLSLKKPLFVYGYKQFCCDRAGCGSFVLFFLYGICKASCFYGWTSSMLENAWPLSLRVFFLSSFEAWWHAYEISSLCSLYFIPAFLCFPSLCTSVLCSGILFWHLPSSHEISLQLHRAALEPNPLILFSEFDFSLLELLCFKKGVSTSILKFPVVSCVPSLVINTVIYKYVSDECPRDSACFLSFVLVLLVLSWLLLCIVAVGRCCPFQHQLRPRRRLLSEMTVISVHRCSVLVSGVPSVQLQALRW